MVMARMGIRVLRVSPGETVLDKQSLPHLIREFLKTKDPDLRGSYFPLPYDSAGLAGKISLTLA